VNNNLSHDRPTIRPSAVVPAEASFTHHIQLRRMADWRNIAAVQSRR
jgi:hypothetical protein